MIMHNTSEHVQFVRDSEVSQCTGNQPRLSSNCTGFHSRLILSCAKSQHPVTGRFMFFNQIYSNMAKLSKISYQDPELAVSKKSIIIVILLHFPKSINLSKRYKLKVEYISQRSEIVRQVVADFVAG